jgi:formate hydrogenlyase subunit 6/NADH:ubiquinone oxidoreductase subunit I
MLKRKMLKNWGWTLKTATHGIEVTRLYPEVMMELPAAERGIHELDATKCIGCASCARICPNSCIEMVSYRFGNPLKNKKMQFPNIDYGRCMFCGLCVDECPVSCLKMGKKVTMAGWKRDELVKGPGDLAIKKFSEKEVAELEAEAKRIAAEKKKAAAAKEAKKPAKEGAAEKPKKAAKESEGAAAGAEQAAPKPAAPKPAEGGGS